MFDHLERLLETDDKKLRQAEREIINAIRIPGPAVAITAPKFSESALNQVLAVSQWRSILRMSDPKTEADVRIDDSIRNIQNRLKWNDRRQSSFKQQLATAHLLKGAISAARADHAGTGQVVSDLRNQAAEEFGKVLAEPGGAPHLLALECCGEQLLLLRRFRAASEVFDQMEVLASKIGPVPGRHPDSLAVALWRQAHALYERRAANDGPVNLNRASQLMTRALAEMPPVALNDLRSQYRLGCMHELHFDIRRAMHNAVTVQQRSRKLALSSFEEVRDRIRSKGDSTLKRLHVWYENLFRETRDSELLKLTEEQLLRLTDAAPAVAVNRTPNTTANLTPPLAAGSPIRRRRRIRWRLWHVARSSRPPHA